MSATTAPIARDTYTGRHTVNATRTTGVFTAAELAAMGTVGAVLVLWEFHGHAFGRPLFGRVRFVPQADGSLVGYDADGVAKVIHPADRRIRVIIK